MERAGAGEGPRFHPLVAGWFLESFGSPTEVQARGWPAIATGGHALLSAPTGSGKTLAAFLWGIDSLLGEGLAGSLDDRARIVYVSPLKALSSDVRRNLDQPLAELLGRARAAGLDPPEIRVALRTGDTSPAERRRLARIPPHIWVTTPESLFLLLTSESGRRGLAGARTVIVDEIHAVAGDKRGAHLALSLERLDDLAGRPLQRIGLSATVSPIEEVARLLGGAGDGFPPPVAIVDAGRRRPLDLAIELPDAELGPIATQAIWEGAVERIAALARAHRSTLVFTNTRKLVERLAHALGQRLGEERVAAHHGSLARRTRLLAEDRLKRGELTACVATASLELGIDIGAIDLVVQVGSPRSVTTFLQRAGRSGHAVGGTPRAILFPLTRDELVECAALVRLARRGELDRLRIPDWPLDVLAQQVVAWCANGACGEDELFARVRRAWSYRDLPRPRFDQVVGMLAEGVAPGRGRAGALLHRDGINRRLVARRGARLAALTGGGAIPDTADYDVVLEPEGTLLGRVNEDFAIESMAGDVFLLGNSAWRIRRIEAGRVRVEDARGAAPTFPFWLGEAPSRTRELSVEVGAVREEVAGLLPDAENARRLLGEDPAIGPEAARQIVAYIEEGRRVLGVVPASRRIVAERFFDEAGGMQLVVHSPWGGRINRAWGLALRKRFCRSFDFELQAAAQDDGLNLSLGPQHSFPLAEVFSFLRSAGVREVLTQAVLPSPIFATRWRWAAARSLALPRHERGRRVPAPLQRMRSEDLLARVFPAQAACRDNAPPGDIEPPDHPLVFETLRDCLEEALDAAGLEGLLAAIERGEVEVLARDTPQPSVFSHQILNAMPYAFLDDAPLEERRARAVSLRRALPEDQRDLGRLDPDAIARVAAEAWPDPRHRDELHEALLALVVLPRAALVPRFGAEASDWLAELCGERRVVTLDRHLAAAEGETRARAALASQPEGVREAVRGWSEVLGPFTPAELARAAELAEAAVEPAVLALEAEGALLRGSFRPGVDLEWCDRRLLARIHRATVERLRREIEPVTTARFLDFLWRWQLVHPGSRAEGPAGLLEAVGLLQGHEAPAAAWEAELLAARVRGYTPEMLDRLCLSGEVVWGRLAARPDAGAGGRRARPARTAPITLALREDLPWLHHGTDAEPALSSRARSVLACLERRGASFAADLAREARLLPAELDDALGELVASGLATADGFAPLRRLIRGGATGARRPRARFARARRDHVEGDGRWWLVAGAGPAPAAAAAERAAQLLRRFGVLSRELLAREAAPPWRELVVELRRAEARGEIRGGRFVAGLSGEQYALPEAVEQLRAARPAATAVEVAVVAASDPLNLAGIVSPGPRIPAVLGARVALAGGRVVAWADRDGAIRSVPGVDGEVAARAGAALEPPARLRAAR